LDVEINEAASKASAMRLLIVSWPPSLEKTDPAVPELIATSDTVTDIPMLSLELVVTACWTTNSVLNPWNRNGESSTLE
jgi:hypothetical protein